MHTRTSPLKRHALWIGILLMYLMSWPTMLGNAGLLPIQLPFPLSLFAGWGVLVAAVLMTWLTLGGQGAANLLKRYLMWRVGWKWYLALLIVPILALLGVWLDALRTGASPDFGHVLVDQLRPPGVSRLAFVIPFLILDLISNGEEIGWRGYVLPRLQTRYSALASALVVGVLWALWHVPLLLTHWSTPYFAVFLVDTMAKSVLLAWLYNSTGGSLLLAALAHSAWNTAGIYLPTASSVSTANLGAFAMGALLDVIAVIVITVWTGPQDLAVGRTRQVQA